MKESRPFCVRVLGGSSALVRPHAQHFHPGSVKPSRSSSSTGSRSRPMTFVLLCFSFGGRYINMLRRKLGSQTGAQGRMGDHQVQVGTRTTSRLVYNQGPPLQDPQAREGCAADRDRHHVCLCIFVPRRLQDGERHLRPSGGRPGARTVPAVLLDNIRSRTTWRATGGGVRVCARLPFLQAPSLCASPARLVASTGSRAAEDSG